MKMPTVVLTLSLSSKTTSQEMIRQMQNTFLNNFCHSLYHSKLYYVYYVSLVFVKLSFPLCFNLRCLTETELLGTCYLRFSDCKCVHFLILNQPTLCVNSALTTHLPSSEAVQQGNYFLTLSASLAVRLCVIVRLQI